jgi:hypothetical protein
MGIRDKPIAPAAPWQNGFVERLIGSIRRECLDHLVVLSEAHLCRILQSYADYYNKMRTDWSLAKDTPAFRSVQHIGNIASHAILGGFITNRFGFEFSVQTTGERMVPKISYLKSRPPGVWYSGLAKKARDQCVENIGTNS